VSKIVVDGVSKQFRLKADRAHSVKELVTRRDRSREQSHFWALKDVSLAIPEGSMYALIGHNGSGKSTLLRCIAGIYRPDGGLVTVDGRISTLLELGAGFHPDLSGRENIYLNATILGMGRKQIDARFDEIVEFAGVEQFIDSPVKVYSTGMYVRLGFSVAVHVQPEILLIDEVIAVGDEEFQRKCFDHLYGLRRQGVTIVVVTHGLATVETMCDRAAWLDHGVLQMEGEAARVAAAYLQRVNEREDEARDASAALPAGGHRAGPRDPHRLPHLPPRAVPGLRGAHPRGERRARDRYQHADRRVRHRPVGRGGRGGRALRRPAVAARLLRPDDRHQRRACPTPLRPPRPGVPAHRPARRRGPQRGPRTPRRALEREPSAGRER
jgi:ABC-type polysaccharide/polyol phosphate transport system ATPase subunit